MTDSVQRTDVRHDDLADDAVALARRWLTESRQSAGAKRDPAAERLAGVLKDPDGLAFAVGFVDGVARPQDVVVAGANLQQVARRIPRFLPWYMRWAVALGGVLGPVIPWIVVPIARRVLRAMVGHLIVDATPERLGKALDHLRRPSDPNGHGARLNLNLLGEAVLGDREAARRLQGTVDLLERDDVDYVSIKVSSVVSQLNLWAFDEAVTRIVERLTPLYELAAGSSTPKFINLDMEEYHDLDLTIAVFQRILSQPRLQGLEAGIVLQAYLPDCLDALQTLTEWATARRAGGGAAIKVRIVKGANLAMERVDAELHDWPQATYPTKQDTDANYLRVLDWALTPQHAHAVRIGVAGHNIFDVAFVWLLARMRGVDDRIDIEMLLGMATAQADAVSRTAGRLLLYTPVVKPAEFDVAISYLIRRLEENSSSDNYMSAVFDLAEHPEVFEREKNRFLASVAQLAADEGPHGLAPLPNRVQDRAREWQDADVAGLFRTPIEPEATADADAGLTGIVLGIERGDRAAPLPPPFRNEPDTDPSLPANRAWARKILARVPDSELGLETIAAGRVDDREALERVIRTVLVDGEVWGRRSGFDRAAVLDRAALALSANRDRLLEVMAAETGKTLAQADVEVSEAVDFAHYYAARARELDSMQGARFVPSNLIVITPPWNFPVSIPAGNVLAALAAGSGVIIKPAPQARRSGAVMVEALWEAGIPRQLLALVDIEEGELGRALVADPRVDRVILTGSYETAELFRSWRPDLPLLAETSGKNAIVVTPDADYDLAVADIVQSAFGHAGQKCSAASLVILVGSVGTSERFLNQLVDAVTTLNVGYPTDPATQMGPLVEPAAGKLRHALTELGGGERWLVEPRQLDDSGRLWSPGVRTDVKPGSYTHLTEFFGPMVSVIRARSLADALAIQNAVDYGLTAGLHSLNADEIALWIDSVEAGNLYVNRSITGAIVQRQPFGGWKRSTVGTGTKAGGPNHLLGLGSWTPETGRSSSSLHLRGLGAEVTELIEAGQPAMDYDDFDLVRRSALSDAIAWASEYGEVRDATGLSAERNLLRYLPVPVSIRIAGGEPIAGLVRTIAAATLARSRFDLSVPVALPDGIAALLAARGVPVAVESDAEWTDRMARREPVAEGTLFERPAPDRIRLLGGDPVALARALGGRPDVAIFAAPVTPAGRLDLLPFLREQAISITNHRFGNPTTLTDEVI